MRRETKIKPVSKKRKKHADLLDGLLFKSEIKKLAKKHGPERWNPNWFEPPFNTSPPSGVYLTIDGPTPKPQEEFTLKIMLGAIVRDIEKSEIIPTCLADSYIRAKDHLAKRNLFKEGA